MGVQNAAGVVARLVDGAVESEAGRVDREWRLTQLVALLVDEHQAGRGDFVETQPIRVDQERVRRAGMRAELCVNTRSLQPYAATSR